MAALDAMDVDDRKVNRRVYGRGLFDGLRMAGVGDPEGFVNASKMHRIEQGLNGIAKKVLDAVPISEAWTVSRIVQELARTTGSTPEFRIVHGCIGRLLEQGLVREQPANCFSRVKVRQPLAVVVNDQKTEGDVMTAAKPATEQKALKVAEPLDRLAGLSVSMRDLSNRVAAMAKEIDEVALDVESRIESIKADTEKLRQLQSLLKSIGQ